MGISKYNSQLEAYFSGNMSATDRILFEGRVESDPMLKAEFERQNDIVEGLKAHRAAELKTRLNNISVEPTLVGSVLQGSVMKSLTYGLTAVMVATGSYLFYNKEAAIQYHVDSLNTLKEYNVESVLQPNLNSPLNYRFEGNMQLSDYVETAPSLSNRKNMEQVLAQKSNEIVFDVPQVNTKHEESFGGAEVDLNALDRVEQTAVISEIDKVNIQTIFSRRYNFHYRIEDNRLFLYGKFNESPYEIIEISTPGNKKLFFFYDGDFYQLKKNATAITPLSKIENRELIQKLDELKARG